MAGSTSFPDFEVAALGFFRRRALAKKWGMPASWQLCIKLGQIFGFHQNAADGAVFG